MDILIDGYNLIFQCGLQGRSAGSDALEKARNRLISELANKLGHLDRKKITIVFDSRQRPLRAESDRWLAEEMKIIFAADYADADELIEELIRKHSAPKKLTVVSSDHRLHDAARRRKATAIDSDVWFDGLKQKRPPAKTDDRDIPENYNPFPPGYGEDLT